MSLLLITQTSSSCARQIQEWRTRSLRRQILAELTGKYGSASGHSVETSTEAAQQCEAPSKTTRKKSSKSTGTGLAKALDEALDEGAAGTAADAGAAKGAGDAQGDAAAEEMTPPSRQDLEIVLACVERERPGLSHRQALEEVRVRRGGVGVRGRTCDCVRHHARARGCLV